MSGYADDVVEMECYSCGSTTLATKTDIAKSGKKVYCDDCLITGECRVCGREMQTTHDNFARFDGKPVCYRHDGKAGQSPPFPDLTSKDVVGRRAIAAIIDLLAIFAGGAMLEVGFIYFMTEWELWSVVGIADPNEQFFVAAGMLLAYVYNNVYLEWATGQSIGKSMMGIVVSKVDGSNCTLLASIIRNLLRPLDAIFGYGLGYLSIVTTKNNQRMGDSLAGTVVTRVAT